MVLTAYVCFVSSVCVMYMWVYQSFGPKPIYLWLPSEMAGRLPAGQSHRDKWCSLHQPSKARQQTNWTNQEQEVPLLRYKHTCTHYSIYKRTVVHTESQLDVHSDLSLILLTSDHSHILLKTNSPLLCCHSVSSCWDFSSVFFTNLNSLFSVFSGVSHQFLHTRKHTHTNTHSLSKWVFSSLAFCSFTVFISTLLSLH